MAEYPTFTSPSAPEIGASSFPEITDPLAPKKATVLNKAVVKQANLAAAQAEKSLRMSGQPEPFLSDQDIIASPGAQALNVAGALASGAIDVIGSAVKTPANIVQNLEAQTQGIILQLIKENKLQADPDAQRVTGVDEARAFLEGSKKVGTIISQSGDRLYNSINADKQRLEAEDAYEKSEGFWNTVINMAEVGYSHPLATVEHIAGSIPQILEIAAVPMVAFAQMSSDRIEQATQIYKDTHDGEAPTGEAAKKLAILSAAAAAVELVESQFLIGKFDKALAPSAKMLANPFINNIVTRVCTHVVAGAAGEVVQEGGSELITQLAGRQTALTDEAYKEAAVAASTAAAPGSGMKAGVPAIRETIEVLTTGAQATAKALQTDKDAIPAEFTPEQAAAFEEVGKAVAQALADVDVMGQDVATLKNAFEAIRAYGEQVIAIQDPEVRAEKEASLAKIKEDVKGLVTEFKKNQPNQVANTVAKAVADTATKEDVAEAVIEMADIVATDPTVPAKAASDILGSKEFQSAVDAGDITPAQVTTLEKHVELRKSVEQVSSEIVTGGDGNIGINEYLEEASFAATIGDVDSLTKIVTALTNWGKTQAEKLEQAQLYNSSKGAEGTPREDGGFHTSGYLKLVETDLVALRKAYAYIAGIKEDLTGVEPEVAVEAAVKPTVEVQPTGVAQQPKKALIPKPKVKPAPVAPEVPTVAAETKAQAFLKQFEALPKSKRNDAIITSLKFAITNKKDLSDKAVKSVENELKAQAEVQAKSKEEKPTPKAEPKAEKSVGEKYKDKEVAKQPKPKVEPVVEEAPITEAREDEAAEITFVGSEVLEGSENKQGHTASKVLQKSKKQTDSIFNKVKDFFRNSRTEAVKAITGELSPNQLKALTSIGKFQAKVVNLINGDTPILKSFIAGHYNAENTFQEDPLAYLIQHDADGNPFIPENILGIVSTIAHDWVGNMARGTLVNVKKDINQMLGRDSQHRVIRDEYNLLMHAGTNRTAMARSLGRDIFNELGIELKPAEEGEFTDGALQARLETALGQLAITSILELGYAEQKVVNGKEYNPRPQLH